MALRIHFFHGVGRRRGAGGCNVFDHYCYINIIIVDPALVKQFTRDQNYVLSWELPLWSVSNKNHYFIRAILIKLCFSELEPRAISVYTLSDVLFLYFSHVGCFRRYS